MIDMIRPSHLPSSTDTIVEYYAAPPSGWGFSDWLQVMSQNIQTGSSSTSQTTPIIFDIDQQHSGFKICFPKTFINAENIHQQLALFSSIFEQSGADILINAITFPQHTLAMFNGPSEGISGIRQKTGIFERPLIASQLLPKIKTSNKESLEKSYHLWLGGIDMIFDNLHHTEETWEERIILLGKEQENSSKRSKSQKYFVPNITDMTVEKMKQKLHKARQQNIHWASVHCSSIGLSSMQDLLNTSHQLNVTLVGTSIPLRWNLNNNVSISGTVLTQLYSLIGLEVSEVSTHELNEKDKGLNTDPLLHQIKTIPFYRIEYKMDTIQKIIKKQGSDIVISGGSLLYHHPNGLQAGAKAFLKAVEAASKGIDQSEAIHESEELKTALEREHMLHGHLQPTH